MRDFFSMTSAEVDAAAERYYDRLLDEYLREDPEPWELDSPDWSDIAQMIDAYKWPDICNLVRDYIEGDGDLMTEIYEAGLLDKYIAPEDEWKRKDPDTAWELIDYTFDQQWEKDDLFKEIYLWLPENHIKKMCEHLLERADDNGIRDEYNKEHTDDDRYYPED